MKNRIGIVGGGQLARMLASDAKRLGFVVTVLDPTPHSPGGQVADEQIVAKLSSRKAMQELAKKSDFLTIEWELADDHVLENFAKKGIAVNPSAKSLRIIKDKFLQKEFLRKNKIPVGDFAEVHNKEGILKLTKKFGYPFLLKARTDAYDGRGNALVESEKDIDTAIEKLKGRALYVEKFVPFTKEVSVMVARSMSGDIATYPVCENIHKNNVLYVTIAPARITTKIAKKAEILARKVMKHLSGAGVFGIEMFVNTKGQVLVNEIAPRVHNSGHFSIEVCQVSQFEQHIRAVTGLPLGSTKMITPAGVMINILGERSGDANVQGLEKALTIPGVHVHIYGKSETRIDRKMGHITVVAKTREEALQKAIKAREYISI